MLTGGFSEPYTFGRRVAAHLGARPGQYDVVYDNQSLSYGLLDVQRAGTPVVATMQHPITKDCDVAVAAVSTDSIVWHDVGGIHSSRCKAECPDVYRIW
ncbi:MAG: hypothetical protein ACI9W2_001014 [Gammaproteobacteria bacterium]|jgi:hypothetical protein